MIYSPFYLKSILEGLLCNNVSFLQFLVIVKSMDYYQHNLSQRRLVVKNVRFMFYIRWFSTKFQRNPFLRGRGRWYIYFCIYFLSSEGLVPTQPRMYYCILGWVNLYKKFEIEKYTVCGKLIWPKKWKDIFLNLHADLHGFANICKLPVSNNFKDMHSKIW